MKVVLSSSAQPIVRQWIYMTLPSYFDWWTEDKEKFETMRNNIADTGVSYVLLHRYIFDSRWEEALEAFLRYYNGQ